MCEATRHQKVSKCKQYAPVSTKFSQSWITIANIICKDIFYYSVSLASTSSVREAVPYGLSWVSTMAGAKADVFR